MAAGSILEPRILDCMRDAVIVTDMHLKIRVWNPAAASIYGWRADDVVGRSAHDLLPLLHFPSRTAITNILSLLHPDGHWRGHVVQVHHDGYEIILDASMWLLHDENGARSGIMFMNRDITREECFRALIESSTDVISVLDGDGRICYMSPAIEQILGSPPDAFVGMDALDLVHPDDVSRVQHTLQALQPAGAVRTVRFRARHQDGTWHHYEALSKNLGDHPAVAGIVTNFRDITAREQALAARQASEACFRAVFEGAALGIALADTTGQIVTCNAAFEQLVGYSEEELRGMPLTEFSDPEDLSAESMLYQELLTHQRNYFQAERRFRRKDHRVIWGRVTVSLVRDASGGPHWVIGTVEDITEQKLAKEQLQHQALHDVLTDLPNRALFLSRLEQSLAHARRYFRSGFAVLFLDLDSFKTVNDSLGHVVGDELLVEIARRLKGTLRPQDTLARLGGDEFVILLEDLTDVSDATHVAQRIHQVLVAPFHVHGHEVVMSTSVGIALGTPSYARPEELLRDADIAMYRAKATGKGQWAVFDVAMHSRAMHLFQVEADLRRAIEHEEFVLHYQPIVSLPTGTIIGVEALVRWQHPEQGIVFPSQFIPIAEDTGLIVPLGEWILRTACAQTKAWHAGFPALTVAVNLSARQFRAPDVSTMIANILADTGLEPQYLKLELTESCVMDHDQASSKLLEDLHAQGIQLAIDDFGTGYSSLSYLQRLPITTVKLDRSFVSGSTTNTNDAAIITAIIALAHTLNLQVIAEGVETTGQLNILWAQQADAIQGYVCSPPLSAAMLIQRLHTGWNFMPDVLERTAP